jgi:hypothetical protein
MPSTGTDSTSDPEPPNGAAIPTVVVPTIRPERITSILHEKSPVTNPTVKFTCSAGIPWLANCGLYGSRVAVTEVTLTGRFPEVDGMRELPLVEVAGELPFVDARGELHPAHDAPTVSDVARSSHGRITRRW